MHPRFPLLFGLASLFFLTVSSEAVINFGPVTNDSDPGTGLPWDHVGAVGAAGASGIYLGNGYMLTANHVFLNIGGDPMNPYVDVGLNGSLYQIDTTFTPTQIGTADLKIFRLTTTPALSLLTLVDAADDEFLPGSLTGFGKSKGTPVTGGYDWETDAAWQAKFSGALETNTAQRWGTNQMDSAATDGGGNTYLVDHFNDTEGNAEAAVTLGDSGSGYFINYGGNWKLVGVAVSVETFGTSYYAQPGGGTTEFGEPAPYNPADYDLFVRVKDYTSQINAIVVPEPSTIALLMSGSLFWILRRRQ